MLGMATSYRAEYETGGRGEATEPLQSLCYSFGGGIGWSSGIDTLGHQVCPLLLGAKVGHNLGNAGRAQVAGHHAREIFLCLVYRFQSPIVAILDEPRPNIDVGVVVGVEKVSRQTALAEANMLDYSHSLVAFVLRL